MIEYINFILLVLILVALSFCFFCVKKYLSLLKMAETAIDNLISFQGPPSDDGKRQKLLECVLTGNSKIYLGKMYTDEQIQKLKDDEVNKLFSIYEAKLSGQMVKSLGQSIIHMYSMGACVVLGIKSQNELRNDLENDPFLNSALQRFTCDLYYRFGSFLSPISVGLITGRHYIAGRNLNANNNIDIDNKDVRGTDSYSGDNEEP